jgi:magnesium-transporting ATPase (P-type)
MERDKKLTIIVLFFVSNSIADGVDSTWNEIYSSNNFSVARKRINQKITRTTFFIAVLISFIHSFLCFIFFGTIISIFSPRNSCLCPSTEHTQTHSHVESKIDFVWCDRFACKPLSELFRHWMKRIRRGFLFCRELSHNRILLFPQYASFEYI